MNKFGISYEEAIKAFEKLFEIARNVDIDTEIKCIKSNPSLSWFQKYRLIKKLRDLKKYKCKTLV